MKNCVKIRLIEISFPNTIYIINKGMANKKLQVLIADDHPIFRQGLKHAFDRTDDAAISGEAENGTELLEKARENKYDAVLMDISMPGPNGLEVLKQLKNEIPGLPVVVLSMYPEDRYAVRFMRAGASGYLTKGSPPDKILEAVRKVAGGGKFMSPSLTEKLAFEFLDHEKAPHENLSDREFEVLCMIASGKTVSEIAADLSLSVNTISTHRTHILNKMNMKNNAQLTHYALQNQLVE